MKAIWNLRLAGLIGSLVAALLPTTAFGSRQPEPAVIETPIALQPLQHGFLFWRQDNGQIAVAFNDIRTKTGSPCQEVYLDTYRGQPYEIPPAPPGLFTPVMGFGWLYKNDPELARRLGYATAYEVSVVAQIQTVTTATGPVLQLQLSHDVPGFSNPLT